MARKWEKDKKLAARFFFSKPITVTGKNFASTVARDIAQSIPSLRPVILSALKEHTDIAACSIQEQLEWIVFSPLRSTSQTHIMVIDALDECSSQDCNVILDSIFKFLNEYPDGQSPLKVLLTSRPEADIMNHFNSPMNKNSIVRLDFSLRPELSQYNLDDIRLYVETYLGDRLIPDEIDKFITRTGGLFIWASTAMQFLLQAKNFKARFRRLMSSDSEKSPLDDLYSEILTAALAEYEREEKEDLLKVLQAICVAKEPLPIAAMTELLHLDAGVADAMVTSLSSVLSDGTQGQPIHVLHPTFLEHLQNSSKPGPIFISNNEAERLLAGGCLSSLYNGLKYDICGVLLPKTEAPKNNLVEDLWQRLGERTTQGLRYAAIHVLSHVMACLGDKEIVKEIDVFFAKKLLNWVELLSFLGKVYSAMQALYNLKCRIEDILKSLSNTALLEVQEWCDETLKLIQPYQVVIGASAMQVYFSALPFFDQTTRISRCFLPSLQQSIPKVVYQRTPSSGSKVLAGHRQVVMSISISLDDQYVTSVDSFRTIRRWEVRTGGCVEELNSSSSYVAIQPLTDGTIAAVMHTESITLHNLRTGKVLWEVQCAINNGGRFYEDKVVFSPDGRFLASCRNLVVQIWDVETGQESWRKQSERGILDSALSPDNMHLVNVDVDGVVRMWNIAAGKSIVLPTMLGHMSCGRSSLFSFSSDGAILAGSIPTGDIRLWYLKDGEVVHHQDIANSWESSSLGFSPFSQILAYGFERTIPLYDAASGKAVGEPLTGHTDHITCLAFLSNGRTLVSGSADTTVRMWDLTVTETVDQPRLEQVGPNREVFSLAFSFDGCHLASGHDGGEICLWDTEAGKVNWKVNGDDSSILSLIFSSDDRTLASGSYNGHVNFWDVASGKAVGSIVNRGKSARSLAFSSDSRLVAAKTDGNDVVLWEFPSGEMIAERHVEKSWDPSIFFHLHQDNNFLIISEQYIWDISADLLYNAYKDKNIPFKLVDLHSSNVTVYESYILIGKSFGFALPPHMECRRHDCKKGKFACGRRDGVELIVDCSHLI